MEINLKRKVLIIFQILVGDLIYQVMHTLKAEPLIIVYTFLLTILIARIIVSYFLNRTYAFVHSWTATERYDTRSGSIK